MLPALTYPIVRPYPFPHFTPSVVLLFIVAAVLFSVFNTIINGYELRVSYATNPNATAAQKLWYDAPVFSAIDKLSPSCEAKEIAVQQTFNTDKSGLLYTISGIKGTGSTGNVDYPSLTYLNNVLENCSVNYIEIQMESASRTAQQVAWQRWGPSLFGSISCSIVNDHSHIRINITTEYDLVPMTAAKQFTESGRATWAMASQLNLFQFIKSSNIADPAMWWAESLMSHNWIIAARAMENFNNAGDGNLFDKGTINFWSTNNVPNISDPTFFDVSYYFLGHDDGTFTWDDNVDVSYNASDSIPGKMLYSSDSLAKAFYSTVLADLGASDKPSILTDEDTLRHFTRNFGEKHGIQTDWVPYGPATDSYDSLKDTTSRPQVNGSTIFTNYLCQIPVQKTTSTLFVSVLTADLVLLGALWTVVAVIAQHIVGKKDSRANWCERCVEESSPKFTEDYTPIPQHRERMK